MQISAPTLTRTTLVLWATVVAAACADLTSPTASRGSPPASVTSTADQPVPTPRPPPGRPNTERVTASNILVAYKGAKRAEPRIRRSKAEAEKLARDLQQRATKKDAKFPELAVQFSDDPTAKTQRGSLGTFDRFSVLKPVSDAAFALKVGEISSVVETEYGYHIIRRDE
jgi:hypothetical protein